MKQSIQEYPNILLALTWCHRSPADTPTRFLTSMVSCKQYVDEIALAADLARQGGATGLAHQGRPVSILDCQIVIVTIGMGLNVEGSEF